MSKLILDALDSNTYTELEYITTNRDAYILTNLTVNDFDRVTARATLLDYTCNEGSNCGNLFGSRADVSGSSNYDAKMFRIWDHGSQQYTITSLYDDTWAWNWSSFSSIKVLLNEPVDYDIKLANGKQYLKINGTVIAEGSLSGGVLDNTYPVVIFGTNYGARGKVLDIPHLDCASIVFFNGFNVVGNFIPARRDSDNVAGMYDTVSNTFYPSASSANFTAGPEVENYKELEYLETNILNAGSDDSTVIRTNYYPSSNKTRILMDVMFITGGTNTKPLSAGTYGNDLFQVSFSGYFQIYNYSNTPSPGDYKGTAGVYNYGTRYLIDYDKNVFKVNDTIVKTFTAKSVTVSSAPLVLMQHPNTGENSNIRIYSCKVYENDILLYDLVPVKRSSDDKLGLYNKVTNEFLQVELNGKGAATGGNETGTTYTLFPQYRINKPGIPVIAIDMGGDKHSDNKYDLYDRVYDDEGKDIGIVVGFQKDENDNEFAVVCLNAEYRDFGDILSGEDAVSFESWGQSTVWEIKKTGTYQTQQILDFIANNPSYTSSGATFVRSQSFIINGVTYHAQLPNLPELIKVCRMTKIINSNDPTLSSYDTKFIPYIDSTNSTSEDDCILGSTSFYLDNQNGTVNSTTGIFVTRQNGMVGAANRKWVRDHLVISILELPNVKVPTTRKYKLFDRVVDDSNNEIGTVSGFTKSTITGMEYAVVCLDAQHRTTGLKLFNDNTTKMFGIPVLNITTGNETIYDLLQTATENTDAIKTTAESKGSLSTWSPVVNYVRGKSFVIDGVTYKGQVPTAVETLDIYLNRTTIDTLDPTGNIDTSYGCHTSTQTICSANSSTPGKYSHVFVLPWGGLNGNWWDNTTTTVNSASVYTLPVLEIPNLV